METNTFKFECPRCGQRIATRRELIGAGGTCPSCQHAFTVPAPAAKVASTTSQAHRYFYCKDGGDVQGPITSADVLQMYSAGIVSGDTQVCEEGEDRWSTIRESGLLPKPPKRSPSTPEPASLFTTGSPKQWAVFGGVILVLVVCFGFLHIVTNDGVPVSVVPKEHFSYSMTLVSVDEILDRYNSRSLATAMRGDPLLDHLVRELERGRILSQHKQTWDEINKKVRDEMPDK